MTDKDKGKRFRGTGHITSQGLKAEEGIPPKKRKKPKKVKKPVVKRTIGGKTNKKGQTKVKKVVQKRGYKKTS